jgi:hypothetical protein
VKQFQLLPTLTPTRLGSQPVINVADMAPRPSLARRTLAPQGEHIYELGVVGRCVNGA